MSKGLIYIITGDGKGKTTAAMGLALRAAGHNQKVLIIQFIKDGKWNSGEIKYIEKHIPEIDVYTLGEGFVGIIDDKKSKKLHAKKAIEAFAKMNQLMQQGEYDILILDEINVAINLKLLNIDEVINFLKQKPKKLHVVLTGRSAPKKLINLADMVSEVKKIKHPFDKGILAQKGIDF
jgi:cob(I)alamin adenosyltransferase